MLTEQIDKYLTHLITEKRYSPRTVGEYRDDLTLFTDFMMQRIQHAQEQARQARRSRGEILRQPIEVYSLSRVTLEDLRAFLEYLDKGRGNKPATQARRIAALRSLFKFAELEGWITANFARRLATPKLPQRRPVYLTPTDSKELVDTIREGKGHNAPRDLAIVTLFLHAGLRLTELLNLDLEDVDLEEGVVRVIGKGNKERVVPLTQEAQRAIAAYLELRPAADTPALFLSHFKSRLSKNALQYMIKARSGNPEISPHKLRHSCATMLHGADVSLVELQRLLGHASIATTQIYTHTNLKRLREAVQRHPLEQTGQDGPEMIE